MSRIRNRRDNNQRRLVYNEADGLSIDLNKPREQLRYECIPQDKLYLEDAVEHTVLHLKAVIDERDELRENLILADIGRRQVVRRMKNKAENLKLECDLHKEKRSNSQRELIEARKDIERLRHEAFEEKHSSLQKELFEARNVIKQLKSEDTFRRHTLGTTGLSIYRPVALVHPVHRRSSSVGCRPAHPNEPIYENLRILRGRMFNHRQRNSPQVSNAQSNPSVLQREVMDNRQGNVSTMSSTRIDISEAAHIVTGGRQNIDSSGHDQASSGVSHSTAYRLDPIPSARRRLQQQRQSLPNIMQHRPLITNGGSVASNANGQAMFEGSSLTAEGSNPQIVLAERHGENRMPNSHTAIGRQEQPLLSNLHSPAHVTPETVRDYRLIRQSQTPPPISRYEVPQLITRPRSRSMVDSDGQRSGIGFSRFPRQVCSELNKVGLPNT